MSKEYKTNINKVTIPFLPMKFELYLYYKNVLVNLLNSQTCCFIIPVEAVVAAAHLEPNAAMKSPDCRH